MYLVIYLGIGICIFKKDRILYVIFYILIYYRVRESIIKIYGSIYFLSLNIYFVKV